MLCYFSKISRKELIQHNRSSDCATRAKLTPLALVTLNKILTNSKTNNL